MQQSFQCLFQKIQTWIRSTSSIQEPGRRSKEECGHHAGENAHIFRSSRENKTIPAQAGTEEDKLLKKKPEKKRAPQSPMEKALRLTDVAYPPTDPQGSWTGRPADPEDLPQQDTDDL